MCVRAPLVPGFELVIGDQVTCLEKVDAAIPSHSRGTVIRHANEPPTEVIVGSRKAKGQSMRRGWPMPR